jgi:hypothetical protein
VQFISRNPDGKANAFSETLKKNLPAAYALMATLFLGLVIKENYSDTPNKMFAHSNFILFLKIWGILAVLFWIPAVGTKPAYTLMHSLLFFFLFAKDLLAGIHTESGNDTIRNDMKIYSISFMINVISLLLMILVNYIRGKIMQNKMNRPGI